jgi:hypothetical protein
MKSRAPLTWLAAVLLASATALPASAQLASWTLYDTAGGKQLSFGTGTTSAQDAPFSVTCQRFELFLQAKTTDTAANARTGTFSLASQRKSAFFTGPVKTIGTSRMIVVPVALTDPVFAMIEEGNFSVRETTGKVIADVKIINTLLKKVVYECRH